MANSPYKLQLTNGYYVDVNQISRLLAVAAQQRGTRRISAAVYMETLGMADRKVDNLASISIALGLIKPTVLTVTGLGRRLYQYDPFLSDVATLWLLHYLVGSDERYVVWNRLVNRVIPENERITTILARPYFEDLGQFYSEKSIKKHLRKEMTTTWNAYTQQAFRHLDYLRAESDQIYVRGEGEPVPPRILLAAAMLYRERYAPRAATLDVPALAHAANSPGRVFGLTERAVRDLLDEVKGVGSIYVESRADLDQVRFPDNLTFLDVVRRYYEER